MRNLPIFFLAFESIISAECPAAARNRYWCRAYCQITNAELLTLEHDATGDSYVVLNTRKLGGDKIDHEIFFWQGKESTQASETAPCVELT